MLQVSIVSVSVSVRSEYYDFSIFDFFVFGYCRYIDDYDSHDACFKLFQAHVKTVDFKSQVLVQVDS